MCLTNLGPPPTLAAPQHLKADQPTFCVIEHGQVAPEIRRLHLDAPVQVEHIARARDITSSKFLLFDYDFNKILLMTPNRLTGHSTLYIAE